MKLNIFLTDVGFACTVPLLTLSAVAVFIVYILSFPPPQVPSFFVDCQDGIEAPFIIITIIIMNSSV